MDKIEITSQSHLNLLWKWAAMEDLLGKAEEKCNECRIVGMGIMVDYLKLVTAETAEKAKIRNVMFAMQNGLNPETHGLEMAVEDHRFYLKAVEYKNGDSK